jgi:V/A-type H+-transporting ATPase subunit D
MTSKDFVPTGRAGRLWLTHRIAVAERGANHLERKLRILSSQIVRCQLVADLHREEWVARSQAADTWAVRASLVAGHDSLTDRSASLDVRVTFTTTIGVRHPVSAEITSHGGLDTVVGSVAVVRARDAFAAAVAAAVELAISEATCAALNAAQSETRRRARLLRRRWLPRLQRELRMLDLALEQAEQEDHARLRLALK